MKAEWAEQVNYWKTSRTVPGAWLERAAGEVKKAGGKVLGQGEGTDPHTDRGALMLLFELDDQVFRVIWPVLPSKTKNEKAARRQAATALYYDVKARCVASKFLGGRLAFFSFLVLPDGRTASQVADADLLDALPDFTRRRLTAGRE